MKHLFRSAFIIVMLLASGCAFLEDLPWSLLGTNVNDIKRARTHGVYKSFALSYDTAYEKVLSIMKYKKMIVFKGNKRAKFIVAMHVPSQVDTTRVGIFFDPISDTETKITIAALADSARDRVADMIFTSLLENKNENEPDNPAGKQ